MTEKNIIVDRKFVCNFMIYRKAIEKFYEEGYSAEDVASVFAVADVPTEYLEVPDEVIHQFLALDLMFGSDEE